VIVQVALGHKALLADLAHKGLHALMNNPKMGLISKLNNPKILTNNKQKGHTERGFTGKMLRFHQRNCVTSIFGNF
jgi:hypothetical protein